MERKVKEFIKQHLSGRGFVETLKYDNEIFTRYVYAYRNNKTDKKPLVKLVLKEDENGNQWVCDNLYYNGMGGYKYIFDEKDCSYYQYFQHNDRLKKRKEPTKINISCHTLWGSEELRQCKDFKYIAKPKCLTCQTMSFIKKCRKYPLVVEMLEKNNAEFLLKDERFLKLKGEKQKEFMKLLSQINPECRNFYSYNQLLTAINYKCDLNTACGILNLNDECYRIKQHTFEENLKVYKYLQKQRLNIRLYMDYINACKSLELVDYDKYPKHFIQAHDKAVERLKIEQDSIIDKHIKQVANGFKLSLKGYGVIIPESTKEFVKLGEHLHNCVGRMDFNKKMARGESLIVAFTKDNDYYACLEIETGRVVSIRQLYGKYNSQLPEDFTKLVQSKILKQVRETIKNKDSQIYPFSFYHNLS